MFRQVWLVLKALSLIILLAGCESAEVVVESLSKKVSTLQVKSSLKAGISHSTSFLVEGICLDSSTELFVEIRQGGNVAAEPVVPCVSGDFSTSFALASFNDGPAELNLISNVGTVLQEQILIDRIAPVLSFSGAGIYDINTISNPILTIIASEPVTSFYPGLIAVKDGGADIANCSFTPMTIPTSAIPLSTISIQISGCSLSGTFDLEFAAGAAGDAVDNLSSVLNGPNALNVDLISPTVTFSPLPLYVNGDFLVTVTSSEAMNWSSFQPSQLILENSSYQTSSISSPTELVITIRPSAAGLVSVAASDDLAEDLLGNPSFAQAAVVTEFDNVAPTLDLISATKNAGQYDIVAVASEEIFGLAKGDFTCSFCTIDTVIPGPGNNYTITVTPTSENTLSLSFTSGKFFDLANNLNTAGDTLSWIHDATSPTVVLSLLSPALSKDFFDFQVVFNESVSGFDPVTDLSSWNGLFTNINIVSDTTYEFRFVPASLGSQIVFIPGMAAVDLSANSSMPSNGIMINFDQTDPFIVSVTAVSGGFNTWTKTTRFEVEVVFSEDINPLSISDINLVATDSVALDNNIVMLGPDRYRFALEDPFNNAEGVQSFQILMANINDLAGNTLAADSSMYEVLLDNRAPTTVLDLVPSFMGTNFSPSVTWNPPLDSGSGYSQAEVLPII